MNFYKKEIKLKEAVSNNMFSFEDRASKEIFVPPIILGNLKLGKLSTKPGFIEMDEYNEQICYGLENFIKDNYKDIYLLDNHNHVFYFAYTKFLEEGKNFDFIHVDQHKDLRDPEIYFEEFLLKLSDEEYLAWVNEILDLDIKKYENNDFENNEFYEFAAFAYTNIILNVGNFIKPLLKEGVINKFYCVDSNYSMEEIDKLEFKKDYILDIDLDFFSKDMDYIDFDKKILLIKKLMTNASAVYFATSPYFIDFEECIRVLKILLDD